MKVLRLFSQLVLPLALVLVSLPASAVTFNLNCVLSGTACTAFPESFGTVTVTDVAGGVSVVVDTPDSVKFIDLLFNLNVNTATFDSPAVYSENGLSLPPYQGLFDLGTNSTPSKGFGGDSGVAFQILGTGFTADNFIALDSLQNVFLTVHLQAIDCGASSCEAGDGSIKVGGVYVRPPDDDPSGEIPEPTTLAIVGAGLCAVYCVRRRSV
jgi:hypothetical protein